MPDRLSLLQTGEIAIQHSQKLCDSARGSDLRAPEDFEISTFFLLQKLLDGFAEVQTAELIDRSNWKHGENFLQDDNGVVHVHELPRFD